MFLRNAQAACYFFHSYTFAVFQIPENGETNSAATFGRKTKQQNGDIWEPYHGTHRFHSHHQHSADRHYGVRAACRLNFQHQGELWNKKTSLLVFIFLWLKNCGGPSTYATGGSLTYATRVFSFSSYASLRCPFNEHIHLDQ